MGDGYAAVTKGLRLRKPECSVTEESFEYVPKTVKRNTTARRSEFQIGLVGAATAKLREPKHVWTRGTNNNLVRGTHGTRYITVGSSKYILPP